MKKYFIILFAILGSILFLPSCNSERAAQRKARRASKINNITLPSVCGKAGEVLIVMDKPLWESEEGSELRGILTQDYPCLPQKEPIFTIYDTPHKAFSGSFVTHRNIIVINVDSKFDVPLATYKKDVWAEPQLVITLSAPNKESLSKLITKEEEKMISAIEMAERDRIVENVKKYRNIQTEEIAEKIFGGSPYFPQNYTIKKKSNNFLWVSSETTYVNQTILMYSYPYTGDESFSNENIIKKRNEILEVNVPGVRNNSYMITSTMKKPVTSWIKYKNMRFAETRGLWELYGDYMGGPFVCHSFLSRDGKNVIVIEGFVYAPKYPKRNYLRYVESTLYSFHWANN